MPDSIAQFANAKYLNLETFRKSSASVRTPVWFAQATGQAVFYVYSEADAGKVKRIRNNSKVRVAPCSFRGEARGEWMDARARICGEEESARGQQLLRAKYGWQKAIADFFGKLRGHKHAVIAIEFA